MRRTLARLSFIGVAVIAIVERQPENPLGERSSSRLADIITSVGFGLGEDGGIVCDEGFQAVHCQLESFLGHVSEAHSEPSRFRAMTRGSGRDIELHVVNDPFPQLHF